MARLAASMLPLRATLGYLTRYPVTDTLCPMVESNADRQRKLRQALKAQGLRRYDVWVKPSEWPMVKRLLERLAKRRNGK